MKLCSIKIVGKGLVTLITLLSFCSCAYAQTARENYSKAQHALEDGNIKECMSYLASCENQLGGTNVRIEALRTQGYVQMDDWVKAKIAYRNYNNMLGGAEASGETGQKMAELGREIDAGLQTQDDAFKKKIEDDKIQNLTAAKEEIQQRENKKQAKKASINQSNGDKLYQLAKESRDINTLTLYKQEAALAGSDSRSKEIDQELDKHKDPNKYLLAAVLAKNQREAEYLIGLGGDMNLKDEDGYSLMHVTVNTQDEYMQRMLKRKGADIEIKNSKGETPLMYALKKDKYGLSVSLLSLGANATATAANGVSALHYAVFYTTDVRAAGMLIEKGARTDVSFSYKDTSMTVLYYAVYYKKDQSLVQNLINHKALIDKGKEGWTPLMAAIVAHDLDMVKILLSNSPNVNAKGIHGWTALHFAGRENQPEMVTALVKAGADKNLKDEWGRTAKNVAYENEKEEAWKAIKRAQAR